MRIGIDASRAFSEERTGTEGYAHELIRHLAGIIDPSHQATLYLRKGSRIDFELPSNFSPREIGGDFLWTHLHLSRELLSSPVDVLFVPAHTVPLFHPRRTVVTIHGLEYRLQPQCYRRRDRFLLELGTRLSARWAWKILTPSEATKKDLDRIYGTEQGKITVIPHGTDCPSAAPSGLHESFTILFVGRLERRKNILRLLRAFETFMGKREGSDRRTVRLVLAGKPGFGYAEIKRAVAASPCRSDISLPGYVTEAQKQDLFAQASLFLFPTLAEGFGLPVLEAMSRGIPVLSSDLPALRETAGEAAILVDPQDTDEIAAALGMLYNSAEERKRLEGAGRRRAGLFSWEKCAARTLEALTETK
jgi:glycosyltransferase involved in cell wall biosynthesis